MKSKYSVAALARKHEALSKLLPSAPDALANEIIRTQEAIRAVASYLPARCAMDRAFHRLCIDYAVDWLGDGVTDPQWQRDLADAVLRMTGLTETLQQRERLLAA
jgi:hypothetical protein